MASPEPTVKPRRDAMGVFKILWRLEYCLTRPLTWEKFFCRWRGHPNGIVFVNVWGVEPDTRCMDCGDDLG